MEKSWYNKVDGLQHWVNVYKKPLRLEHSCDTTNPLVGGGYFEIITADIKIQEEMEDLGQYFKNDEVFEMMALARTLKRITEKDFDKNSEVFYRIYEEEINKFLLKNLNERSKPEPAETCDN